MESWSPGGMCLSSRVKPWFRHKKRRAWKELHKVPWLREMARGLGKTSSLRGKARELGRRASHTREGISISADSWVLWWGRSNTKAMRWKNASWHHCLQSTTQKSWWGSYRKVYWRTRPSHIEGQSMYLCTLGSFQDISGWRNRSLVYLILLTFKTDQETEVPFKNYRRTPL